MIDWAINASTSNIIVRGRRVIRGGLRGFASLGRCGCPRILRRLGARLFLGGLRG